MKIVRGDNQKPVGGIATAFFSAKFEKEPEKPGKRKEGRRGETGEPPEPPDPKPKRYRVDQIDGGFAVRRGDPRICVL